MAHASSHTRVYASVSLREADQPNESKGRETASGFSRETIYSDLPSIATCRPDIPTASVPGGAPAFRNETPHKSVEPRDGREPPHRHLPAGSWALLVL